MTTTANDEYAKIWSKTDLIAKTRSVKIFCTEETDGGNNSSAYLKAFHSSTPHVIILNFPFNRSFTWMLHDQLLNATTMRQYDTIIWVFESSRQSIFSQKIPIHAISYCLSQYAIYARISPHTIVRSMRSVIEMRDDDGGKINKKYIKLYLLLFSDCHFWYVVNSLSPIFGKIVCTWTYLTKKKDQKIKVF